MKKLILSLLIFTLAFAVFFSLALIEVVDTTAPVVAIETPNEGDILFGTVDIYGTITEDIELSHYNISIYPGNADFNNFSLRLEQKTEYLSAGFNNQNIYTWGTSTYSPGAYLIRLAARDKAGNRDLSGDAWSGGDDSQHVIKVYVVDQFVSGGGHFLEEKPGKRKDWFGISFGGFVGIAGAEGLIGEWEVNFHNVGNNTLDKTKFHTTDISKINFYDSDSGTCAEAMNFTAYGEWNGIPGYKMIFRAGDADKQNGADTVRVTLWTPGGSLFYDSSAASEFTDESSCVGSNRTGLDNGNIQIVK